MWSSETIYKSWPNALPDYDLHSGVSRDREMTQASSKSTDFRDHLHPDAAAERRNEGPLNRVFCSHLMCLFKYSCLTSHKV